MFKLMITSIIEKQTDQQVQAQPFQFFVAGVQDQVNPQQDNQGDLKRKRGRPRKEAAPRMEPAQAQNININKSQEELPPNFSSNTEGTAGVVYVPGRKYFTDRINGIPTSILALSAYKDRCFEELRMQDYKIMRSGGLPQRTQERILENIQNVEISTGSPIILPSNFCLPGLTEWRQQMPQQISQGDQDFIIHLKRMFLNPTFSDVTFVIEDQELPAHKNILAARCKFFENMFKSGMVESSSPKIQINDTRFSTFKGFLALLEFIYCNELEMTEDLALELLEVSDKYSFIELKEVCERFLGCQLNLDNFEVIAKASEQFEASALRESVIHFVANNRESIQNRQEHGQLSSAILWDIIFRLSGSIPISWKSNI